MDQLTALTRSLCSPSRHGWWRHYSLTSYSPPTTSHIHTRRYLRGDPIQQWRRRKRTMIRSSQRKEHALSATQIAALIPLNIPELLWDYGGDARVPRLVFSKMTKDTQPGPRNHRCNETIGLKRPSAAARRSSIAKQTMPSKPSKPKSFALTPAPTKPNALHVGSNLMTRPAAVP